MRNETWNTVGAEESGFLATHGEFGAFQGNGVSFAGCVPHLGFVFDQTFITEGFHLMFGHPFREIQRAGKVARTKATACFQEYLKDFKGIVGYVVRCFEVPYLLLKARYLRAQTARIRWPNGVYCPHCQNYGKKPIYEIAAIFKRGVVGSFHHISEKHLPLYLAEFDFRYNQRSVTDGMRTLAALKFAEGKRLTYKPLIGASP